MQGTTTFDFGCEMHDMGIKNELGKLEHQERKKVTLLMLLI